MPESLNVSRLLRLKSAAKHVSIDLGILLKISFLTLEDLGNLFQIKYSIAVELFLLQCDIRW